MKKFNPLDPALEDRYMCDSFEISSAMGYKNSTRVPENFPPPTIIFDNKRYWRLSIFRAWIEEQGGIDAIQRVKCRS